MGNQLGTKGRGERQRHLGIWKESRGVGGSRKRGENGGR